MSHLLRIKHLIEGLQASVAISSCACPGVVLYKFGIDAPVEVIIIPLDSSGQLFKGLIKIDRHDLTPSLIILCSAILVQNQFCKAQMLDHLLLFLRKENTKGCLEELLAFDQILDV